MALASRVVVPEWMDELDVHPRDLAQALTGLRRLNALAASHRLVVGPVLDFARTRAGSTSVVDIASGGGDLAIAIARRAHAESILLDVRGVDFNATTLEIARAAAAGAQVDVAFEWANVLNCDELGFSADVLTCSLFLHHASRTQAVTLLRAMARTARVAIVVVDLLRTRTGLWLAAAASRLVTRSPIVHYDATASVRAAYSFEELRQIAGEAGLERATLERVWPQRARLVWKRP